MSKTEPTGPSKEFLRSLVEAITDSAERDPEALREALREEGINHDELLREGLQLVHRLQRQQRFTLAKERREKMRKLVKEVTSQAYEGTKEDVLTSLRELFAGQEGSPAVQTYFHKLESLPERDLREMISEAEILKLLKEETDKQ
jgi:hypothetical protein